MKTKLFKILTAIAVVAFVSVDSNAQEQIFTKGDKDLNLGAGFGYSWLESGYTTSLPMFTASVDYALRDDWGPGVFGVGGIVGTGMSKYTMTSADAGYRTLKLIFAVRATYHYTFVENLDTYGGAALGFAINSTSNYGGYTGEVSTSSPTINDIFVGAKYYFNPGFAVFSELTTGISIPYLTMGVALKF